MKKPDVGLMRLGGYAGAVTAILILFGMAANFVHNAVSQEIEDFRQEQAVIDAKQDMRTDPLERDYFEDEIYYAERSLDDINFSLKSSPDDPDLLRRKSKTEKRIDRFESKLEELNGDDE